MAVSGFLAEVQKTDLEALSRRYPEAFERERLMGVRFVPFLGDKAKAQ